MESSVKESVKESVKDSTVQREPALVLALVQAIVALAVSFGLKLTPEQVGAILAVTAAAAALVVRGRVTPAGGDG